MEKEKKKEKGKKDSTRIVNLILAAAGARRVSRIEVLAVAVVRAKKMIGEWLRVRKMTRTRENVKKGGGSTTRKTIFICDRAHFSPFPSYMYLRLRRVSSM